MSLLCNAFSTNDSICVNTGEAIVSSKNLSTSFVNTCTVIAFKYDNIKFMAHIDAINPNMENIIEDKLKNLNLSKISKIYVWKGSKCFLNCPSFNLANKIINKIGCKNIVYLQSNNDIIRI